MALAVNPCYKVSTTHAGRSLCCPAKSNMQCWARQVVADLLMSASDIRHCHTNYTLRSIAAFALLLYPDWRATFTLTQHVVVCKVACTQHRNTTQDVQQHAYCTYATCSKAMNVDDLQCMPVQISWALCEQKVTSLFPICFCAIKLMSWSAVWVSDIYKECLDLQRS